MIGESNHINFYQKLREFTSSEPLIWFFTPKKFNGKPFCGKFDESSFELTSNSHFVHVKRIKIKGTYKITNYDKTKIEFTIGLSKVSRILFNIFLFIFFLILNVAIIFSFPKNENNETDYFTSIILANFLFLFVIIPIKLQNYIANKNVKKKFYKYFEIKEFY